MNKADIKKALDKMDWKFLDLIRCIKGFGNKWKRWIYGRTSFNFSIMINAEPCGKITAIRNLRQGDPLSNPFYHHYRLP